MRQLEQMMQELRQQIAAVEQGQKTPASADHSSMQFESAELGIHFF